MAQVDDVLAGRCTMLFASVSDMEAAAAAQADAAAQALLEVGSMQRPAACRPSRCDATPADAVLGAHRPAAELWWGLKLHRSTWVAHGAKLTACLQEEQGLAAEPAGGSAGSAAQKADAQKADAKKAAKRTRQKAETAEKAAAAAAAAQASGADPGAGGQGAAAAAGHAGECEAEAEEVEAAEQLQRLQLADRAQMLHKQKGQRLKCGRW
jgi:hypothetical protein